MAKLKKLFSTLADRGLSGTFSLVSMNVQYQYRLWLDRQFDRRFGTDTSGRIELDGLTVLGKNKASGVYYEPTPTELFRFFLENTSVDHTKFTFVDLGSGTGRVLLLASDYPFASIIGVEFAKELHARATANVAVYKSARRRCFNVKSVNADATAFELPAAPLFIYAYNPFDEKVMTAVLRNLILSLEKVPRDVVLLYYNPRWWVMEQFPELALRTKLAVPHDPTREVQRPAAIYANFVLPRKPGWL